MSRANVFEFARWCMFDNYKLEIANELYKNPDSDLYYWCRLFSDYIGWSRIISRSAFIDLYYLYSKGGF